MSARVYASPAARSSLRAGTATASRALNAAIDRIAEDPGENGPFRFAAPRELQLGPVILDISAKVGLTRYYIVYRLDPTDPTQIHILDIGPYGSASPESAG